MAESKHCPSALADLAPRTPGVRHVRGENSPQSGPVLPAAEFQARGEEPSLSRVSRGRRGEGWTQDSGFGSLRGAFISAPSSQPRSLAVPLSDSLSTSHQQPEGRILSGSAGLRCSLWTNHRDARDSGHSDWPSPERLPFPSGGKQPGHLPV